MTLGVSGGQCSITCSAGGQASGPEIMRASDWSIPGYWPLIGYRGNITVGQATWSTTGLAWTMGTRTLWESISDHRPPDIRLISPTHRHRFIIYVTGLDVKWSVHCTLVKFCCSSGQKSKRQDYKNAGCGVYCTMGNFEGLSGQKSGLHIKCRMM